VRKSSVWLVALAVAGVLIATLPFGRPGPRRTYTNSSTYSFTPSAGCASPVVSAWRSDPASRGGWFGYAPLTDTPLTEYPPGLHVFQIPAGPGSCSDAARQRLAIGALLAAPGVFVFFHRRRRLDPPTNPNPNLAT